MWRLVISILACWVYNSDRGFLYANLFRVSVDMVRAKQGGGQHAVVKFPMLVTVSWSSTILTLLTPYVGQVIPAGKPLNASWWVHPSPRKGTLLLLLLALDFLT